MLIGHGSARNQASSIRTRTVADRLDGLGLAAETRAAFLEHAPRVDTWQDDTAARNVIVMKRSLSPGFAGIDNPLFYLDRTMMFFGDAKGSMVDLVRETKEV